MKKLRTPVLLFGVSLSLDSISHFLPCCAAARYRPLARIAFRGNEWRPYPHNPSIIPPVSITIVIKNTIRLPYNTPFNNSVAFSLYPKHSNINLTLITLLRVYPSLERTGGFPRWERRGLLIHTCDLCYPCLSFDSLIHGDIFACYFRIVVRCFSICFTIRREDVVFLDEHIIQSFNFGI
jgi:hypothetical protein